MTIIITIFAVIGAILTGVILSFFFLLRGMNKFREEYAHFVRCFIEDFSQTWDLYAVSANVNDALRQMAVTPNGLAMLSNFQQLGKFSYIANNVEIKDYKSGTNGKTGLFCFTARFEHADALVAVGVCAKKGGSLAVESVSIEPIQGTQNFRQSAQQPARQCPNSTNVSGNVVEFWKK